MSWDELLGVGESTLEQVQSWLTDTVRTLKCKSAGFMAEEKEENGNSAREARCRKRAAAPPGGFPKESGQEGCRGGEGPFGRE